jgi:hypothetical protein
MRAHAVPRPGPGRFAGALPESSDRAFVLEAVHEAHGLHYGRPGHTSRA